MFTGFFLRNPVFLFIKSRVLRLHLIGTNRKLSAGTNLDSPSGNLSLFEFDWALCDRTICETSAKTLDCRLQWKNL
jgi:hypothetical protein